MLPAENKEKEEQKEAILWNLEELWASFYANSEFFLHTGLVYWDLTLPMFVQRRTSIDHACMILLGGIIVNGVPREVARPKTLGACGPLGFGLLDLPRHSIHHDTPLAFPNNVPLFLLTM